MKRFVFLALLLAFALPPAQAQLFKGLFKKKVPVADSIAGMERLGEVMNLIQTQYVSDPNTDRLSEEAVRTDGAFGLAPSGLARTIVSHRPVGVAALIFAFLIAEGAVKTRNIRLYLLRLFRQHREY